jgi:uncharacterized MnhB-related membrane protein
MVDAGFLVVIVLGAVICAYRAITSPRILTATIHLAFVSAATAMLLYSFGAAQVAVIELSVGAGLVTVLLVYAISVVGDEATDPGPVIPGSVAVALTLLAVTMLGWMAFSLPSRTGLSAVPPLARALWEQRVLDVWIQMVLIFAGVLGILGLLAETRLSRLTEPPANGNGHRTVRIVPRTACGIGADRPAETVGKEVRA